MSANAKVAAAYGWGGGALVLALGVILAALGFEHIGGYVPCELCLMQRWAYYASLPALFLALVLVRGGVPRPAALLFFAVALGFLANAGLGIYQAGAEWGYWPGPSACSGARELTGNVGNLLKDIDKTIVVRCDQASWRMFGLSFAGWNVVVSFALFIAGIKATFLATPQPE